MKKSKVVLNFIRFSVAEKIEFYRNIIHLLTGNPSFPQPDVSLAVLTTLVDALEADSRAAQSGAHAAVAKMNQSKDAADEAFHKLAGYVNRIANGDAALILGSGFQLAKQPEPAQRPNFAAEIGKNPGEIDLTRKAQPGAKSYIWQYCIGSLPTNGDGSWVFAGASTQATYTITDLESGAKCWFRVAGVFPDGMGPWSDPVMKVVG